MRSLVRSPVGLLGIVLVGLAVLAALPAAALVMAAWRLVAGRAVRPSARVVVAGRQESFDRIGRTGPADTLVGYAAVEASDHPSYLGPIDRLPDIVRRTEASRVVFDDRAMTYREALDLLEELRGLPVTVRMLSAETGETPEQGVAPDHGAAAEPSAARQPGEAV